MEWFNWNGLIIVAVLMIPNIIFGINRPESFENNYKNKAMFILEQIGRDSCFAFMVFNIPYTYFNFWFDNAYLVYIIVNGSLVLAYMLGWILCWKYVKLRYYILSIIPSVMFIFSGIMLLNIPLIVCSAVFAFTHIFISIMNSK